jgi:tetrahydromethanopterin S-methyltransferase subunit E
MRKIGGALLGIGLGILIGWGFYWLFDLAFPELHTAVKIGITSVVIGLALLLISLVRERIKTSKEDRKKFKGVEN